METAHQTRQGRLNGRPWRVSNRRVKSVEMLIDQARLYQAGYFTDLIP